MRPQTTPRPAPVRPRPIPRRGARRRAWLQKPPEERIAGRLQFWVLGRRAKRHGPTVGEIAARRAELPAELPAAGGVS